MSVMCIAKEGREGGRHGRRPFPSSTPDLDLPPPHTTPPSSLLLCFMTKQEKIPLRFPASDCPGAMLLVPRHQSSAVEAVGLEMQHVFGSLDFWHHPKPLAESMPAFGCRTALSLQHHNFSNWPCPPATDSPMPEDTPHKTNATDEEEPAIQMNEDNHGMTPTAPQAAGAGPAASINTTSPGSASGAGGGAAAPPTGTSTSTTSGGRSSTIAFDDGDNNNDQGATTITFPTTLPPPPPPPLGVVSTALPHRHSMRYLLYPHYKPRPLRLPVDIDALLLVVGALVVPNPKGFIVTDETLVHGHSLWRFLVRLFGSSCLGRSEANESGTWRSLTRALSQWGDKKPERLDTLLGATRWERECRTSEYFMRLPRGGMGEPVAVKGTFIVGISLKNPLSDPSFHPQFQAALNAVAPGLSPARYMMIVEQYLSTVWMSHEALDIERAICVHNRLAGGAAGVGGKRRNLWRTAAAEEALAKKEETPFQALVSENREEGGEGGAIFVLIVTVEFDLVVRAH